MRRRTLEQSVPTLVQSSRIALKTWRPQDFADFQKIFDDPQLTHFTVRPGRVVLTQLFDKEQLHQREHGCQSWALWKDDEIIGSVGLHLLDESDLILGPVFTLQCYLLKSHWGQGFATEASAHAMRYAFERLGAHEIRAFVRPENQRAISMLTKLRFTSHIEHQGKRIFSRRKKSTFREEHERIAIVSSQPEQEPMVAETLMGDERISFRDNTAFAPGTVVKLQLKSNPSQEAEVTRVLAMPKSASAKLYDICRQQKLDPHFPKAVLDEVASHLKKPGIFDRALEDLSHVPFVTIDNEDSKDLDQAVYIERSLVDNDAKNGEAVALFYALADAAYYAPTDSAIFAESLKRGASYYLPGFAIPMLPRTLSEGLTSLNPNVARRALVFRIGVKACGTVTRTRLFRARVKSRMKLTYEGVQAFYDDPKSSPISGRAFAESLELFKTLGQVRLQKAIEKGVVRYERNAVKTSISKRHKFELHSDTRNNCELYNEQISLLCNMEGARFFVRSALSTSLQPVFRNHAAPEQKALDSFRTLTKRLAEHRRDEVWLWNRGETLADYLARLVGADDASDDHFRVAKALHRQAMVLNVRSVFEPLPAGHYGIGADAYARFSSPMREVVGVYTHKEAFDVLRSQGPKPSDDQKDQALREAVMRSANASKEKQKAITKSAQRMAIDALFLEDAKLIKVKRPIRTATVMGFTPTKMHVQLDEPTLDLKLYFKDFDGPYKVDKKGLVAEGTERTYTLGDRIELQLAGFNKDTERWRLIPYQGR